MHCVVVKSKKSVHPEIKKSVFMGFKKSVNSTTSGVFSILSLFSPGINRQTYRCAFYRGKWLASQTPKIFLLSAIFPGAMLNFDYVPEKTKRTYKTFSVSLQEVVSFYTSFERSCRMIKRFICHPVLFR